MCLPYVGHITRCWEYDSETDKNTCPQEAYILAKETDSKINKTYCVSHADKGHREKESRQGKSGAPGCHWGQFWSWQPHWKLAYGKDLKEVRAGEDAWGKEHSGPQD